MKMFQIVIVALILSTLASVSQAQQTQEQRVPVPTDKVAKRLDEVIKDIEDVPVEVRDREELLRDVRDLIRRRKAAFGASGSTPVPKRGEEPRMVQTEEAVVQEQADTPTKPMTPTSGRIRKLPTVEPSIVEIESNDITSELAQLTSRVKNLERELASVNKKLNWLNGRQRKLTSK